MATVGRGSLFQPQGRGSQPLARAGVHAGGGAAMAVTQDALSLGFVLWVVASAWAPRFQGCSPDPLTVPPKVGAWGTLAQGFLWEHFMLSIAGAH